MRRGVKKVIMGHEIRMAAQNNEVPSAKNVY